MDMFMPPIGSVNNMKFFDSATSENAASFSNQKSISEFNTIFLQAMLKEVFKDAGKNNLLDESTTTSLFLSMLNEELIKNLSEQDVFELQKRFFDNDMNWRR